jgi:hypothetical protein
MHCDVVRALLLSGDEHEEARAVGAAFHVANDDVREPGASIIRSSSFLKYR